MAKAKKRLREALRIVVWHVRRIVEAEAAFIEETSADNCVALHDRVADADLAINVTLADTIRVVQRQAR